MVLIDVHTVGNERNRSINITFVNTAKNLKKVESLTTHNKILSNVSLIAKTGYDYCNSSNAEFYESNINRNTIICS